MNTTIMTVVTYVELEDCLICDWDFSWEHPFKKEVTKKKLVPRRKVENVTKVINVETCCDGWHKSEGDCVPFCKNGCVHGNCSAPHTCSCETGYTGATCDIQESCPPGTWGQPHCSQPCQCQHGGHCSQVCRINCQKNVFTFKF